MSIEIYVDDIEREAVTRRGDNNREWTLIDANLDDRISQHSRLSVSIRGLMLNFLGFSIGLRKSLIFQIFPDSCRYFHPFF
jgi:hypothetical protein